MRQFLLSLGANDKSDGRSSHLLGIATMELRVALCLDLPIRFDVHMSLLSTTIGTNHFKVLLLADPQIEGRHRVESDLLGQFSLGSPLQAALRNI